MPRQMRANAESFLHCYKSTSPIIMINATSESGNNSSTF